MNIQIKSSDAYEMIRCWRKNMFPDLFPVATAAGK